MPGVEYITVVCEVCGTRMVATAAQLGETVECPDCFTKAVVRRPAAAAPAPKKRVPAVQIGEDEYRLCEGVDQPPPAGVYVPVVCSVCGTRMHAPEDQVGRAIACPDCGTREVVPAAAKRVKIDPMSGAGEGYGLCEPIRPPEVRVGIDYRTDEPGVGELPSDRVRWWRPEEPRPRPRWTFFSGVFTFPFYRGSLGCWLGLSGALMVLGLFAASAVSLAGIRSEFTYVAAMGMTGVTFALGMAFFVAASAYLLATVRDTAAGNDEVQDWPGPVFLLVSTAAVGAADLAAAGLAVVAGGAGAVLGTPLAAAALMVYFRLVGRLTWLVSGEADERARSE